MHVKQKHWKHQWANVWCSFMWNPQQAEAGFSLVAMATDIFISCHLSVRAHIVGLVEQISITILTLKMHDYTCGFLFWVFVTHVSVDSHRGPSQYFCDVNAVRLCLLLYCSAELLDLSLVFGSVCVCMFNTCNDIHIHACLRPSWSYFRSDLSRGDKH